MEKKQSLLSKLFFFAGKHKYLTISGMVLSGISAVIVLLPIVFIWIGISEMFKSYPDILTSANIIKSYAWYALGCSILGIFIYFIALMCTHVAAFRVARNMRTETLKHLMKLPLGYFNQCGSGKIRRIVDTSAGETETFLAHQLPDLIGAFVTPVAVIVLLFVFNWKLGLISIIPMIIGIIFLSRMIGPKMENCMKYYQNSLEDMNNEAVEYVRGIPVVKTFGQSVFSFKKFHESIISYRDWAVKYTISLRNPMSGYTVSINAISVFLVFAGVLLIGTVTNPKVFLLDFIFYLMFTPVCVTMMNKIMWTSENFMLAEDAMNRIYSILNEKPLKESKETYKPENSDIEFEGVSFNYPNARKSALSDVNFKVTEGSTVALVGPSGGGKSTAASLIPRFWDVSKGTIKIGGIDVKNISTEDLMKNISFVFQNSNLFKASLLDNIKEGKPTATEEEVMIAVKAAQCEDIIRKFSNGIHTIVGTKGTYLSGGEVQRIALARAILKNAPIILLDEATAFADPENEHQIQLAFEELTKGKTVLIIAHRLSTIQNADCIYVLDEGKISESGTHKELINKDGTYASMWKQYETSTSWKVKEGGGND